MEPTSNPKLRLDAVPLSKCVRTDEGYLKVPATITRAGIFEYRRADGTIRRELRRPEQVFRADSMASFENLPFVDGHPYEDGGVVTAKNVRRLQRGVTLSPTRQDGSDLLVDVLIQDAEMVKQVEAGKRALSCGYRVDTIEEPGVWNDQPYDAEQINIRGNHVASVRKGRAGERAVLKLDEDLNSEIPPEENDMDMVQIKLDDGRTVSVASDVADAFARQNMALSKEKLRADEAESLFAESDKTVQSLTGKLEGLQTRLDEATDEAKFNARVTSRVALLTTAKTILPKAEHTRLDAMKDVEVMQACIRADAADPDMKFDGHSEDRIRGRFDQLMVGAKQRRGDGGLGARVLNGRRADGDMAEDGKDQQGEDEADKDSMTPEEREKERKKKLTERYKKPIREKK